MPAPLPLLSTTKLDLTLNSHVGLKYHHFRSHVTLGLIKIFSISTFDQVADIFTKPLPAVTFVYLRKKLMGW